MKKLIVLLPVFLALASLDSNAMDSWQVLFSGKAIFKGNEEIHDITKHVRPIAFKKTDRFTIRYTAGNAHSEWKRTFYINDGSDKNLKTLEVDPQSRVASFEASVLEETMNKKRPVLIYTTSLPKDPSKAATVRVRRILLCTIEWN